MMAGHQYPGIYTIFSLCSILLLHIVCFNLLATNDPGRMKKEIDRSEVETL